MSQSVLLLLHFFYCFLPRVWLIVVEDLILIFHGLVLVEVIEYDLMTLGSLGLSHISIW